MLTRLVPALGVLALLPVAGAQAQEVAKGLFINGWSDNILNISRAPQGDKVQSVDTNGGSTNVNFTAKAKVMVGWNPVEHVSAKVGIRGDNSKTNGGAVTMDEAYMTADVGNGLTVTAGKYVNHVGWVSYEPTGLFRVNSGIIPVQFYSINVIGANIAGSSDNIGWSFHVVNGYSRDETFNDATTAVRATPASKKGTTLAYGFDLVVGLGEGASINLETAIDPAGGTTSTADDQRYGWETGINATLKPNSGTTIGAELIHFLDEKSGTNEDGDAINVMNLGFLLMGNFAVTTDPCPMSFTAMYQAIDNDYRGKDVAGGSASGKRSGKVTQEFSVALLTNPLNSSSFGLNAELNYTVRNGNNEDNGFVAANDNAVGFAFEGIVVIP